MKTKKNLKTRMHFNMMKMVMLFRVSIPTIVSRLLVTLMTIQITNPIILMSFVRIFIGALLLIMKTAHLDHKMHGALLMRIQNIIMQAFGLDLVILVLLSFHSWLCLIICVSIFMKTNHKNATSLIS